MLVAFEAAARHGSFARAAEELVVTEGAVSRQIARLETLLTASLFDRRGNRVQLTDLGVRYARELTPLLTELERATTQVMTQAPDAEVLELAVISTFAGRWLIPRLPNFYKRNPGIAVNLTTRNVPFVLGGSRFSAAIAFADPAWAGMSLMPLFRTPLLPVCAPDLIRTDSNDAPPLSELSVLPLLHKRSTPNSWHQYASEFELPELGPATRGSFELFSLMIDAALAGLGVALVPAVYVAADIATGRLVAPWPAGRLTGKEFALIIPPAHANHAPLRAFSEWLTIEADDHQPAGANGDKVSTTCGANEAG